jgi:hypothetical protein
MTDEQNSSDIISKILGSDNFTTLMNNAKEKQGGEIAITLGGEDYTIQVMPPEQDGGQPGFKIIDSQSGVYDPDTFSKMMEEKFGNSIPQASLKASGTSGTNGTGTNGTTGTDGTNGTSATPAPTAAPTATAAPTTGSVATPAPTVAPTSTATVAPQPTYQKYADPVERAYGGEDPNTTNPVATWVHSDDAKLDIKNGSTAYYGPSTDGENVADSQKRIVYQVNQHNDVTESTVQKDNGTTVKYQTAFDNKPLNHDGDYVHLDDGSGKVKLTQSDYRVGEVIRVDGKEYKVTGYSGANYDGSLNVELTPQGVENPETVTMNTNDMAKSGKVEYLSAQVPTEIDSKYGRGDTINIGGKQYEAGTVYNKGEKAYINGQVVTVGEGEGADDGYYIAVKNSKGETELKSFKSLDEANATVETKASRSVTMGFNTEEAHRQDQFEANRTNLPTVGIDKVTDKNAGTIYKGKVGSDEVYIQYKEDGSKVITNAKTGQVMTNVEDSKIDVYSIQQGDGHGVMGGYEGRKGVEVGGTPNNEEVVNGKVYATSTSGKLDAAKAGGTFVKDGVVYTSKGTTDGTNYTLEYTDANGKKQQVTVNAYELNQNPAYKVATENKSVEVVGDKVYTTSTSGKLDAAKSGGTFVKDGVVYTSKGTTDGQNYTFEYTDANGDKKQITVNAYELNQNPAYKVASENQNVEVVGDKLYTTSTSGKLDAAKKGGTFVKDGVVYTSLGTKDGTNYTFEYTDANGNKQQITVNSYELNQNPEYKVVTGEGSSTAVSEAKSVEYKDGAYRVTGFVTDAGEEGVRSGGTSQAYMRPENRDEYMWSGTLTKKAGLPGMDSATSSNPLKYSSEYDAVKALTDSGQYTVKEARNYVQNAANNGQISYTGGTSNRKLTSYYESYKSDHQNIYNADYKNKAEELRSSVTELQTWTSNLLAEMDTWTGKAKDSTTDVVKSLQGKLKETMVNITQCLEPACEAAEHLDEKLQELEKEDEILKTLLEEQEKADKRLETANTTLAGFDTDAEKYEWVEPTYKTNDEGKTVLDKAGYYDTSKETSAYKAAQQEVADATTAKEEADKAVEEQQVKEEELCFEIDDMILKIKNLEQNIKSLKKYVDPTSATNKALVAGKGDYVWDNYEDLIYDFESYESFPVLNSIYDYNVGDLIELDDGYGYLYKVLEINPDGTMKIIRCDRNGNEIPGASAIEITDSREIAPALRGSAYDSTGKITNWGDVERALYIPPTTVTQSTEPPTVEPSVDDATDKATEDAPKNTTKAGGGDNRGGGDNTGGGGGGGGGSSQPTSDPSTVTVTVTSPTVTVTAPTLPTLVPTLPNPTDPTRLVPTSDVPVVPVVTVIPTGNGDDYVPHTGIEAGMGVNGTQRIEQGNAGALGALAGLLAGAAGVGMTAMAKDKEEEKEEEEKKDSEDKENHEENKVEKTIPLSSE